MQVHKFSRRGKRTRPALRLGLQHNHRLLLAAVCLMVVSSSAATYGELQKRDHLPEHRPSVMEPSQEPSVMEPSQEPSVMEPSQEPSVSTSPSPSAGPAVEPQPVESPLDRIPTLEGSPAQPTAVTKNIYEKGKGALTVYFHKSREGTTMALEEYLLHVLAGEVPYSFNLEALKAQTVAARSYAVYRSRNNNGKAHPNGEDICTDPGHCLAFVGEGDFSERFGSNEEKAKSAYNKAILATEGEILVYGDEVALGVFHAMSGGQTEAAAAVWGGDYPYLNSAPSKGEEAFQGFETSVTMPLDTLWSMAVEQGAQEVDKNQAPLQILERSSGGGVTKLLLYGQELSGAKARSLFSLRTNLFEVQMEGEQVVFRVLGWGHRVGMSQYGAEAMGTAGADYLQILGNYYQSCTIEKVEK